MIKSDNFDQFSIIIFLLIWWDLFEVNCCCTQHLIMIIIWLELKWGKNQFCLDDMRGAQRKNVTFFLWAPDMIYRAIIEMWSKSNQQHQQQQQYLSVIIHWMRHSSHIQMASVCKVIARFCAHLKCPFNWFIWAFRWNIDRLLRMPSRSIAMFCWKSLTRWFMTCQRHPVVVIVFYVIKCAISKQRQTKLVIDRINTLMYYQ